MSIFNRSLVAIMALVWCAVVGLAIYLIWDQSKNLSIDSTYLKFNFDLALNTSAERVLATIIAGALALPALLLLAMEMVPQPSRGYSRTDRKRVEGFSGLEARVDDLQKRLDEERDRRNDAEKQIDRERGFARDEAKRNAEVVRTTNGQTISEKKEDREVVTSDGRVEHQRRWHLLPKRS